MDSELQQEIQKIIFYIEEFENGNDEYYYDMLEIIKALESYVRHAKCFYLKGKLIYIYSKIITFITANSILTDDFYNKLDNESKENLRLYIDSVNTLNNYNKICKKTGDYGNLDAAYLLTIKLSQVLANFFGYLSEIRTLENSTNSMFAYIPGTRKYENYNNTNEEVKILVKAIKEVNEEI